MGIGTSRENNVHTWLPLASDMGPAPDTDFLAGVVRHGSFNH